MTTTRLLVLRLISIVGLCLVLAIGTALPASAALRTFNGLGLTGNGQGYLLVSSRGEFYAFGNAAPQPNVANHSGDIVDVAVTADGRGAMAVSSAGQFYAYGTVQPQPNPTRFSGSIVGVAVTADGRGTMAVTSTGQFYAYGTARAQPNPANFSGTVVDVALTADGQGAMAVSSAGQFYAYGTARAQPNPVNFTDRITALDITADGQGAVAVSIAGQLYAYGTARAQVNPTNFTGGIVAVDLTADGQGLMAMSGSGQTYAYGTAKHLGNGDPGTATSSENAQLAQELLNLQRAGRISFSDYSSNPAADRGDRSLASQQVADIAAGKMAQLSRRCSHPGLPYSVQPDTRVLRFLVELGRQSRYRISTLFGQCHSTNSLHYRGQAVDFECGLDTAVATSVGARHGVARNSETCAANAHWHYSVGGR